MNNCNTSPLFVPTTINALIRNIDAVDVTATSISCDKLTISGEPISDVLQNIGESSLGVTRFDGELQADSLSVFGDVDVETFSANSTSAGVLTASTISTPGTISAMSMSTTGDMTIAGNLSVDTNVIKTDATNNRVGINVTAPTEALDVSGNAKVSGSGTFGSAVVNGNLTVDTSTLFVNSSSNRVGINTAAPTQGFHVMSNAGTSTIMVVDTSNNRVGINTATPSQGFQVMNSTGTSTAMIVDTTNLRLGVGKSTPTVPLDVVGNALITGDLSVVGTALGGINCTGSITASKRLNAGGDLMVNSTLTAGDGSSTMYVDVVSKRVGILTDAPTLPLDVRGDVGIAGNLNMVGDAGITGTVAIGGNLSVTGTLSLPLATNTVTVSGSNWDFTLKGNYTRLIFSEVAPSGTITTFQLTVTNRVTGTTFSGFTHGSNGNAKVAWAAGTLYVHNNTASVINDAFSGWIDFYKTSSTRWTVSGYSAFNGNTAYFMNNLVGTVTFPGTVYDLRMNVGPGTGTGTVNVYSS
jgi:hypothetical protein